MVTDLLFAKVALVPHAQMKSLLVRSPMNDDSAEWSAPLMPVVRPTW